MLTMLTQLLRFSCNPYLSNRSDSNAEIMSIPKSFNPDQE